MWKLRVGEQISLRRSLHLRRLWRREIFHVNVLHDISYVWTWITFTNLNNEREVAGHVAGLVKRVFARMSTLQAGQIWKVLSIYEYIRAVEETQ